MAEMTISSPAFDKDAAIPEIYTCDGRDFSPPLTIRDVPAGTKSLALVVDDPDAPGRTWVHWVVWNINPSTREIAENAELREAICGKNDWHRNSYGGPCPPSGTHHYRFNLYALDAVLELPGSSSKPDLDEAMEGHVLAQAQLVGVYSRK